VSSYVGLIGYEALLGVTGYGLLVGLGIARGSLGDWKLSGLAFLVGWELVGVVGSIALMLGLRIDLASFILLAVAAGAASATSGSSSNRSREWRRGERDSG
jgi:hypothetical protein